MTDESWDLTATAVVSSYSAFYLKKKPTQLITDPGWLVSGRMKQVLLSRHKLHRFTVSRGNLAKCGSFELAIWNILKSGLTVLLKRSNNGRDSSQAIAFSQQC